MGAVKFSDRDLGMKSIRAELKRLARTVVTVGVHGTGESGKDQSGGKVTVGPRPGEDITMPQLAAVHEFGTDKIPERSFIRSGVDRDKTQIQRAYDVGYSGILDGSKTAQNAGALLGIVAVGAIKMRIFDGIAPQLAPATKKKRDKSKLTGKKLKSGNAEKTGYTPLLDTGQLAGSIAYQVDTSKGGR